MITVKQWMELVNYRITEGSDFCWDCFGADSYSITSWNGDQDGWSFNIIFDTSTQVVYTVEACDYKRNRAYRLIHPEFKVAYDNESMNRDVPSKQAWDDIDYIDLETDDDWLEKSRAIIEDKEYDTRISVPINLENDELLKLFMSAHEADLTFNQYIVKLLEDVISNEKPN